MEWIGDKNDLIKFGTEFVKDVYVIKFDNKIINLFYKKAFTYKSYNFAKSKLREHLYCNFCQGHYWHEKLVNTFSIEKGWMRNNSQSTDKSSAEFKIMAKELTDHLLENKIFEIVKLEL